MALAATRRLISGSSFPSASFFECGCWWRARARWNGTLDRCAIRNSEPLNSRQTPSVTAVFSSSALNMILRMRSCGQRDHHVRRRVVEGAPLEVRHHVRVPPAGQSLAGFELGPGDGKAVLVAGLVGDVEAERELRPIHEFLEDGSVVEVQNHVAGHLEGSQLHVLRTDAAQTLDGTGVVLERQSKRLDAAGVRHAVDGEVL